MEILWNNIQPGILIIYILFTLPHSLKLSKFSSQGFIWSRFHVALNANDSIIFCYFPYEGRRKNFKKYEHGKLDSLNLPYDFDSVMHYDRLLFSVDGKKPTIIRRGQPWVKLGGQLRGTLTTNDVHEINALYGC